MCSKSALPIAIIKIQIPNKPTIIAYIQSSKKLKPIRKISIVIKIAKPTTALIILLSLIRFKPTDKITILKAP